MIVITIYDKNKDNVKDNNKSDNICNDNDIRKNCLK